MKKIKTIKFAKTVISTKHGRIWVFCFNFGKENVLVVSNKPNLKNPLHLRIHSACITSEVFGSLRCDCRIQLDLFLEKLYKEKRKCYALFYFCNHEGRGNGIFNKIRVYEVQRRLKLDTYEANRYLNLPIDARNYEPAIKILEYFKISTVFLYTNNIKKIKFMERHGINVIRKPLLASRNISAYSLEYLKTKAERGGHLINIEHLKKMIKK
jgi:GTP cyclohydrolase II